MTELQRVGREIAARAAGFYLRKVDQKPNLDCLAAALERECLKARDEAFRDASDAMAANMTDVALQTFQASYVLAGLAAAKACLSGTSAGVVAAAGGS
jgi:hypothetical protein